MINTYPAIPSSTSATSKVDTGQRVVVVEAFERRTVRDSEHDEAGFDEVDHLREGVVV